MAQKLQPNEFEINHSVAHTLIVLLKSKQGKEIFQRTIRDIGKELTSRLQLFYEKIKNEPFVAESEKPKIQKNINDLISLLTNFPFEDIIQIIKEVEGNYSVGNFLLLEGYILAIYEFLKEKFHYYYELIRVQQLYLTKVNIANEITSAIPENVMMSAELLSKLFPNVKGFQTIDNKIDLEKKVELMRANGELIKKGIQYNESNTDINFDFYKQLISYDPNDKKTQKQFDKFKKKIEIFFKEAELNITDSTKALDESIVALIENSIYNLVDYRKEIMKKDLRKTLPTLLSGTGGFSLF